MGEGMLVDFDIQAAAQAILSEGRIVEADAEVLESGVLDARDASALIEGDAPPGAAVKGSKSLLIQGAVLGSPNRPCRIQVSGDVVITGGVEHARIAARSIRIGKGAERVRLDVRSEVWIGGDLVDSEVTAGEFKAEKQRIEQIAGQMKRLSGRKEYLERQLDMDERRLERQIRSTTLDFDFNAGQIVRRTEDRVKIELSPFYRMVEGRAEADVDRALLQFFAKGVVGVLARRNRARVLDKPNRQKILMGVIRGLHNLLLLQRKFDKQSGRSQKAREELEALIEALKDRDSAVHIRGALRPRTELKFVIPEVARTEAGEVDLKRKTAGLTVREGQDEAHRQVTQVAVDGEAAVFKPEVEALQGITVRMREGRPVWKPVEGDP